MLFLKYSAFVLVNLFVYEAICQEDKGTVIGKGSQIKQNSDGSGTISMGTPDLNDEDSQSDHMPSYLKCDACRIISMHFYNAVHKEINKYKSGPRELSEDTVLDTLESVCESKWDSHGIKEVNNEKRLSGPGFETSEVPGVMQGGGKWPFRFTKTCFSLLEEYGEDNMYQIIKTKTKEDLEDFLCRGDASGDFPKGVCNKSKSKPKKKKNKSKSGREMNEL